MVDHKESYPSRNQQQTASGASPSGGPGEAHPERSGWREGLNCYSDRAKALIPSLELAQIH
eukprot:12420375-Karenia_brevis.AAC.1